MAKYKMTIEVEAFKFCYDSPPEWFNNCHCREIRGESIEDTVGIIKTPEGEESIKYGDYVVKYNNGLIQKRKEREFEEMYSRQYSLDEYEEKLNKTGKTMF